MLNPKTIIEVDYQFDDSQMEELKKFLDKYYDIYDHDVAIYKAEDYAKQSFFAQSVFEEIQKEMALENSWVRYKLVKFFMVLAQSLFNNKNFNIKFFTNSSCSIYKFFIFWWSN